MKDRLNDLCENISRVKSLFFSYTSSQTNMRDKGIIEEDLIKLFDKIDSQIIRAYRVATLYENTDNTICNALNKIEKLEKENEQLKQQIEKMMCCMNCGNQRNMCLPKSKKLYCSRWSLAE